MNIKKLGFLAIPLLGVAVWMGVQQYNAEEDGLPPLDTETVDSGEVSQRVVAHGALEPVHKVTVGSQVSGIVDEVLADFNSRVERGQPIAQLDPSTFEAELRSAEAELEAAEATLELARHEWERVQELREEEFVSPSDVDEASANLRQGEANLRVRRHDLERAQREVDRTTIHSPTDGIVIARNVEEGQTVAASLNAPELFEIATDLSQMQIHANVSEADIGLVAEDQTVIFTVDAYRDREFEGEVIQVRNAPIVEDNVVHYETIIAVENDEGLLKPGMTAEVSVITEEREDVLRVRNTALRARLPDEIRPPDPDEEEDAIVYLVREGELIAAAVETGLDDGVHTEILDGLEEGDVLAVGLSLSGEDDEDEGESLFGGEQAQY